MQKVVFVDRDGVINEMVYFKEHGFVDSPFTASQFRIINGVPKAIKLFHSMGFKVIIISNQPGIAKKHFTLETFELMKNKLHVFLKKNKTFVDDEFYCLHHPDAKLKKYKKICDCRKPKTGLIKSAIKKYDINLKKSFYIGDGIVDLEAAKKVNCKSIFIGNVNKTVLTIFDKKKLNPNYVAKNLLEAANIIKKN